VKEDQRRMHPGTRREERDAVDLHATRWDVQHFHARGMLLVVGRIGVDRLRCALRDERVACEEHHREGGEQAHDSPFGERLATLARKMP